jgi:hypothetical protein
MDDINNLFDNFIIEDNFLTTINEEIELLKMYIFNSIDENVFDIDFLSLEPNDYITSNEEYEKIKSFFEKNPDYLFQNLLKKLENLIDIKIYFNFINDIVIKYLSYLSL